MAVLQVLFKVDTTLKLAENGFLWSQLDMGYLDLDAELWTVFLGFLFWIL